MVEPAPVAQAPAAITKPEREVVWEPADEGGLAADWMAVKGAGWVEAPSDFDDGEGLVGRRVFVLDEYQF